MIVINHTLGQLLSKVYPDLKINNDNKENDIWTDNKLASYFVEYLKNKQTENELSFLNRVIRNIGYKGESFLIQLLKNSFPNYVWSFGTTTKKSQYLLKEGINLLFPGKIILEEYIHPDVKLQLDYFLPQFNLAFEYQVKSK